MGLTNREGVGETMSKTTLETIDLTETSLDVWMQVVVETGTPTWFPKGVVTEIRAEQRFWPSIVMFVARRILNEVENVPRDPELLLMSGTYKDVGFMGLRPVKFHMCPKRTLTTYLSRCRSDGRNVLGVITGEEDALKDINPNTVHCPVILLKEPSDWAMDSPWQRRILVKGLEGEGMYLTTDTYNQHISGQLSDRTCDVYQLEFISGPTVLSPVSYTVKEQLGYLRKVIRVPDTVSQSPEPIQRTEVARRSFVWNAHQAVSEINQQLLKEGKLPLGWSEVEGLLDSALKQLAKLYLEEQDLGSE